jgi:accessory gene regulator protein AgrB
MKAAIKSFLYGLWLLCASCGIVFFALIAYVALTNVNQCDNNWGAIGVFIIGIASIAMWVFLTGCFGQVLVEGIYYKDRYEKIRKEQSNSNEVQSIS